MISNMQEIDKLRSPVQEVHVPLEVFEYIDGGRNPQLYTKDCMEKALAKNEQVSYTSDEILFALVCIRYFGHLIFRIDNEDLIITLYRWNCCISKI